MLAPARQRFNRAFDLDLAQRIRRRITDTVGEELTFPLGMSPVFVDPELARRLLEAVRAFFDRIREPAYQREAAAWVPERYRSGVDLQGIPRVSQFDFALGRAADGEVRPYMLECQGCSSLMGIVPWFGHLLAEEMTPGFTPFLGHASWEEYREHLQAVLGDSVLVDVETRKQRLRADFWVLRHFAGIAVADLDRPTLKRLDASRPRVYSRVVPAEAERSGDRLILQAFCTTPRDWASNPDWFFMLSKRGLNRLREVSDLVPETVELTAETAAWDDLAGVVLKPCYDFGGRGVNLDPTPADIRAALTSGEPHVLQEKVTLAPVVQPPDGPPLFCDLRVLCLEDRPVSFFCRLARDRMCNIVHNQSFPWCGITVGLLPAEAAARLREGGTWG